jgi:hypothetical protein
MAIKCETCLRTSCEDCEIASGWKEDEIKAYEAISVISGMPDCPLCFSRLKMNNPTIKDNVGWTCTNPDCATDWHVGELIEAINNNNGIYGQEAIGK